MPQGNIVVLMGLNVHGCHPSRGNSATSTSELGRIGTACLMIAHSPWCVRSICRGDVETRAPGSSAVPRVTETAGGRDDQFTEPIRYARRGSDLHDRSRLQPGNGGGDGSKSRNSCSCSCSKLLRLRTTRASAEVSSLCVNQFEYRTVLIRTSSSNCSAAATSFAMDERTAIPKPPRA